MPPTLGIVTVGWFVHIFSGVAELRPARNFRFAVAGGLEITTAVAWFVEMLIVVFFTQHPGFSSYSAGVLLFKLIVCAGFITQSWVTGAILVQSTGKY